MVPSTSVIDLSPVAMSPTHKMLSNAAPVAATATGFQPLSTATIPFAISFATPWIAFHAFEPSSACLAAPLINSHS